MTQVRESTVNFDHLLDDHIKMYDCPVDATVLVESVANALDAKATQIDLRVDAATRKFTITDNGEGMDEQQFEDYHNFAMSSKQRGRSIGFAGLGAKLGLKIASEIVTETCSNAFAGASRWWFQRGRVLWEPTVPALTTRGTRVHFPLNSARKWSILDADRLREMLLAHYLPLFLPKFVSLYRAAKVYPHGVKFTINGAPVAPDLTELQLDGNAAFNLLGTKQRPIGVALFVLAKSDLPPARQGVALCTYGKVIKWDWLDRHPRQATRITGVVEVPDLVECLTTNKADFVKYGSDGQRYYRLRRVVQQAFGTWLETIGEGEQKTERRDTAKLEQVLNDILKRLPAFGEFFGAQHRKPVDIASADGEDKREMAEGGQITTGTKGGETNGGGVITRGDDISKRAPAEREGEQPAIHPPRRVRTGPSVTFVDANGDERMSWVDGNTVVINEGHSAYRRAQREKWLDYHNLWAAATALVEVSGADPSMMFAQLSRFFGVWGAM